jgi:hypothetical protein
MTAVLLCLLAALIKMPIPSAGHVELVIYLLV